LTIEFRETVEQSVLEEMTQEFLLADLDQSGALDRKELAGVVQRIYRSEQISRNKVTVQKEVQF